ncbi:MAG TPA: hypothetical protein DC031_01580 [Sulfitobacter sp.]|uniref:helix-turn-helix domain-containing protein n=1 Tax=Sulfitobacter TaxID=60136 RepID=UPI000E824F80|nr:hypothetical protein [Sulfitobacter sp.]
MEILTTENSDPKPRPIDPRLEHARTNMRLAVALRKTNYSEVARAAGLSRNALSQFVDGRTTLSYINMLKICDVLDIPIGSVHRPDAISSARLRLHRALEALPDHALEDVAEVVRAAQSRQRRDN